MDEFLKQSFAMGIWLTKEVLFSKQKEEQLAKL